MKDIYYSTQSEKRLIASMQEKIGITANGIIGMNTLSTMAFKLGATDALPVTLELYGQPVIIGRDILAFNPGAGVGSYANSMTGVFTYPRATTPCSIFVNSGRTLCGTACHAHNGKPETVIYKLTNGRIGIQRASSVSELPLGVKWAVGGMGLLDYYDPEAEGFTGAYADVLRKTNHNVLGIKNGLVYGVYFKNKTAAQINTMCRDNFHFDKAVLLDGGGLAAMYGGERFAQINTKTKQGAALQFI